MLFRSLPAITAAAGFYILGRSLAAMKLIAAASIAASPSFADRAISVMVNTVSLFLPSLDQMTASAWLVNPPAFSTLLTVFQQSLLYTGLLAAASLFDLYRKNL